MRLAVGLVDSSGPSRSPIAALPPSQAGSAPTRASCASHGGIGSSASTGFRFLRGVRRGVRRGGDHDPAGPARSITHRVGQSVLSDRAPRSRRRAACWRYSSRVVASGMRQAPRPHVPPPPAARRRCRPRRRPSAASRSTCTRGAPPRSPGRTRQGRCGPVVGVLEGRRKPADPSLAPSTAMTSTPEWPQPGRPRRRRSRG